MTRTYDRKHRGQYLIKTYIILFINMFYNLLGLNFCRIWRCAKYKKKCGSTRKILTGNRRKTVMWFFFKDILRKSLWDQVVVRCVNFPTWQPSHIDWTTHQSFLYRRSTHLQCYHAFIPQTHLLPWLIPFINICWIVLDGKLLIHGNLHFWSFVKDKTFCEKLMKEMMWQI